MVGFSGSFLYSSPDSYWVFLCVGLYTKCFRCSHEDRRGPCSHGAYPVVLVHSLPQATLLLGSHVNCLSFTTYRRSIPPQDFTLACLINSLQILLEKKRVEIEPPLASQSWNNLHSTSPARIWWEGIRELATCPQTHTLTLFFGSTWAAGGFYSRKAPRHNLPHVRTFCYFP